MCPSWIACPKRHPRLSLLSLDLRGYVLSFCPPVSMEKCEPDGTDADFDRLLRRSVKLRS